MMTDIRKYFCEYADAVGSRKGMTRAVNALMRANIHTMEQLCETTYKELVKIRNVGEKSLLLIGFVRWQYMAEHDLLEKYTDYGENDCS
jgi:hypothetical protein